MQNVQNFGKFFVALRHCEKSEAIQKNSLDCFGLLAMTKSITSLGNVHPNKLECLTAVPKP